MLAIRTYNSYAWRMDHKISASSSAMITDIRRFSGFFGEKPYWGAIRLNLIGQLAVYYVEECAY